MGEGLGEMCREGRKGKDGRVAWGEGRREERDVIGMVRRERRYWSW